MAEKKTTMEAYVEYTVREELRERAEAIFTRTINRILRGENRELRKRLSNEWVDVTLNTIADKALNASVASWNEALWLAGTFAEEEATAAASRLLVEASIAAADRAERQEKRVETLKESLKATWVDESKSTNAVNIAEFDPEHQEKILDDIRQATWMSEAQPSPSGLEGGKKFRKDFIRRSGIDNG